MATQKSTKPTITSLNTGMGNLNKKVKVTKKVVKKTTKKTTAKKVAVATSTNSTNAPNATNTNVSTNSTVKVPCTLNSNFAVTNAHNTFICIVGKVLTKAVPGIQVQQTNNAINWACNSNTGRPNCRVGGFYLYNGVLQLQCRWLQPTAIAYIKKHGLTIVNAQHKLAKSNNLQLPTSGVGNTNHVVAILKLQAQAYQAGTFTNVNTLI